ncbi:tetratricopeptide repeat protein [bacterium]|nr:tetratricopeptide repeat protein [bacterium]
MQLDIETRQTGLRRMRRGCRVASGLILSGSFLLSLVACGLFREEVIIPRQPTVAEQFAFADSLYREFANPIHQRDEAERATKARAAFEQVIKLFPGERSYAGRSRLGLAMIEMKMGRPKKALRGLEDLIEEYPDDETIQIYAQSEAGGLYDDLGKHRKAKEYYWKVWQRFGQHPNGEFQRLARLAYIKYQKVWTQ